MRFILSLCMVIAASCSLLQAAEPKPLKILFLGDKGHHAPADRYRQLVAPFEARKIEVVYTDNPNALSEKTLAPYDGLIVFANIDNITPDQEKALLDYVNSGKGFIPIHCASYCFRNSPKYIDLVGAQFSTHGTGVFRVTPSVKDNPITKDFSGFESWDESYVHTKHNTKNRTVLEYREARGVREPWTWIRTEGKGRVFYTAWGHDARTWSHPGFLNLLERGVRWACGDDPGSVPAYHDAPAMVGPQKDVKPFDYVNDAKIPFYPAGERWGTTTEPLSKMQNPLSAEESVKHYQHPADLEMKLFASEPNFGGKPIAMNWDERGRLWVCVTLDYPNEMKREGEGRDRIVVCEDTDGDGVADQYSVFADKLSIPTTLTFAFGGVIVHQAPHTLFLRDNDGDGKADERKVLFTGWGTNDTHAGPSNLRYGLDGWYYGIVGYSGYNGTIAGENHRFSQGLYRFHVVQDEAKKVSVDKLEFLRNTNNNSWGVGISEDGLIFASTANNCPSVYLPISNRYYEKVRGWSSSVLPNIALSNRFHPITDKVRQVDQHGGFTSGAGHALYTARNYPKEYWNRTAFVTDPTGHLAATFVLQQAGTDFIARYGWNIAAGDDEWIAPIMAEVGPDGNVWLLDWYNFIVQHNPTPVGFKTGKGNAYESELRDKKFGRAYRMVSKSGKEPPLTLKDATTEQLVQALSHPNMFWRLHAQRLLIEKKQLDAVPSLVKKLEDTSVDGIGLNPGVIHSLWTLKNLGAIPEVAKQAIAGTVLKHPSAGVRRNAALVLLTGEVATFLTSDTAEPDSVKRLLNDKDPLVRLAALLALSERPANDALGEQIAALLSDPNNMGDRWLPDAITTAAATHDIGFLKGVVSKKLTPQGLVIVSIVSEHLARRAPTDRMEALVAALPSAEPKVAETIIVALAKGWPKGKGLTLSDDSEKALASLLSKLPATAQGPLVKLATNWGAKTFVQHTAEITKKLTEVVVDEAKPDADRIAAAKQLAEFQSGNVAALNPLFEAITPRSSPALAAGLIEAIGSSSSTEVSAKMVEQFASWAPSMRTVAIRVLLARADSTRALLQAIEKGSIPLDELSLDQKQALASHPERAIARRARELMAKGGGLPNADRQKVIEELLEVTKAKGDATAGQAMFTKHCAACHMHSGQGNKIGPDLTGMAVHPKEELLVHIMDPSRSVEGNFRLYTVRTADGRVLNGMLASETKTSVELIDSQAKRSVLLREDIDSLTASTKSLMPEGFEKQMNKAEITNLLEFLTKRGQFLPIPLDKAVTIVTTKGMFYDEASETERLVFDDWKPKTIEGVPFVLIDPQGTKAANAIMLNSPNGSVASKMPKSATVLVNSPAKNIYLLSGVSGWGFPYGPKGSTSLIVRLHYDDGKTEDHALKNGEHFADYIRRVDVPGSKFAFNLQGKQVRYLAIAPQRANTIKQIEFLKGNDTTAPVIMAVTVEGR
jgi:putative membrane-bound dehydrogenase-like protein